MFEFSKTHNANKPTDQTESDLSRKKKTKFNMRFVESLLYCITQQFDGTEAIITVCHLRLTGLLAVKKPFSLSKCTFTFHFVRYFHTPVVCSNAK